MSVRVPNFAISRAKEIRDFNDLSRWAADVDDSRASIIHSLGEIARALNGIESAIGPGKAATLPGTRIVRGPVGSTTNNIALFADASGSVIKDGGTAGSGDVLGPASVSDMRIPRWDGTSGNLLDESGVTIDDTAFRLRQSGGEWIGMASTTAMTAQQTHTAANTETTMHSEAQLSGILDVAGRVVSVRAFGTNSVDVTSTVASQIIRLKYGSTAVWQRTNTLAVPGGAYTLRWLFMADVITTSSGNVRCFGWMITEDSAGALSNIRVSDVAVARTPTTTGAVTVALTDQWDVNDANTTWTTEMCQIYLGGLTA